MNKFIDEFVQASADGAKTMVEIYLKHNTYSNKVKERAIHTAKENNHVEIAELIESSI